MNEGTPIRLPVGARDFLPRAAARRRAIAEALLAEFERWGYERIITPAFEYADVLARGLGADARAAAIRFVEPATGDVVALRPDITPQVARIAATRLADAAGPLRLCYEGSVMRLLPGARGQKELIQAGVELIGAPAPEGDAEAIALAASALAAAGILDATVDVGHVALAAGALGAVADPARRAELRNRVARKDVDGVARAAAAARVPAKRRRVLEALPELHGEPAGVLRRARALPLAAAERAAVDDVERVLDLVAEEGTERLTVDLGETRGFEYYTGIRFACYVPGCGDAAVRGGRYDDLVGRYGRGAQATGFAVDVEAVAQAEKARGVPAPAAPPGVLVVERGPMRERAFRLASALRRAGARAALDLAPHRAGGDEAILAYATSVGLRVVLVLEGRRARAFALDGARPVSAAALAAAGRGTADALAVELGLLGQPRSTHRRRAGWPSS